MKFAQLLAAFKKWSLTALVVIVSIVFAVTGLISGQQFVDLHTVVIPAFVGANMVEVGKEVFKELKQKVEK